MAKYFAIKNADGVRINGSTDTFVTAIQFRDAAVKTEIIDAFCERGAVISTDPLVRQQFFHDRLKDFIRGEIYSFRLETAQKQTLAAIVTQADVDLP